jgi:hypothetical protein
MSNQGIFIVITSKHLESGDIVPLRAFYLKFKC